MFADCVAFCAMDGGGMMRFASDLSVARLPLSLLFSSFLLQPKATLWHYESD